TVEIFLGGVRQQADHVAGGRVVDVLLGASAALDEFAVDVKAQVFVHGSFLVVHVGRWIAVRRWRNGNCRRSRQAGPGVSQSMIAAQRDANAARKWFFALTQRRRNAAVSMPCSA